MLINSLALVINGAIMFKVEKNIEYFTKMVILFVSNNISDAITVIPIWIYNNNNAISFLENFGVWCLFLLTSRWCSFLILSLINKIRTKESLEGKKKEEIVNSIIFFMFYLYIICIAVVLLKKHYSMKSFLIIVGISTIFMMLHFIGFFVLERNMKEKIIAQKEVELLRKKQYIRWKCIKISKRMKLN